MSAPTYVIRNVWDFLKVPEDRLPVCLAEFAVALDMARNANTVFNAISDEVVGAGKVRWGMGETFTWIDDDAHTATIKVRNPVDGSEDSALEIKLSEQRPPVEAPADGTDQSGPCVAWRIGTGEDCILENDHDGPHVFPSDSGIPLGGDR